MSKVSVALRVLANLHCWAEREERGEGKKERAWKSLIPNSSLRYSRQAKGKTTVNTKPQYAAPIKRRQRKLTKE